MRPPLHYQSYITLSDAPGVRPLQYHVVFVPFGVGSSTADKSIRVLKRISNLSFLKLILIIAYNFKIILYHARQIVNEVRNIFYRYASLSVYCLQM